MRSVFVAGATVTVATGTRVTVIDAVPLCPSLVAVIVALPLATAVTRPLVDTVAIPASLVDQVIVRPLSGLPAESFATALNCAVVPVCSVTDHGVTLTVATGTSATVIAALPLCPSLVAVIVTEPAATPLTKPAADTVATPVALLDHVTPRPVRTLPAESLVTALSCSVDPTFTLPDDGVTVNDATGTTVTVIADVPLLPSLVAMTVAKPAATAVTKPPADTVAT